MRNWWNWCILLIWCNIEKHLTSEVDQSEWHILQNHNKLLNISNSLSFTFYRGRLRRKRKWRCFKITSRSSPEEREKRFSCECVCGNVSCRDEGDAWKECCALLIFLFSFYRNLLLTACRPLLKSWWVTSHITYAELNANISLFNRYLLRPLF